MKCNPDDGSSKPFYKRVHKYYTCECGEHLKVVSRIKTAFYGILEYMRCKKCHENMVAQDDNFLGIAAK